LIHFYKSEFIYRGKFGEEGVCCWIGAVWWC